MAKNNNLGDFLTDIANAIRNKKGSVGTINAQDFSTEIASIQTGITPTGNINITNTNSTNVTNYATAQVVDNNLIASNIKKDVSILGITGTFEGGSSVNGYTLTFNSSCSYLLNTIESDGSSHIYDYSQGYSGTIQNVVYCIIMAQYAGMPYIQKNSGSAKINDYVNHIGSWRQMSNFEWVSTNSNVLIKLESDCSFVIGDDD